MDFKCSQSICLWCVHVRLSEDRLINDCPPSEEISIQTFSLKVATFSSSSYPNPFFLSDMESTKKGWTWKSSFNSLLPLCWIRVVLASNIASSVFFFFSLREGGGRGLGGKRTWRLSSPLVLSRGRRCRRTQVDFRTVRRADWLLKASFFMNVGNYGRNQTKEGA